MIQIFGTEKCKVTRAARRFFADRAIKVQFIDLREKGERERHGVIPGALHAPYPELAANLAAGGLLRGLAANQRLMFYCAFGERSAMAVQAAQDARLTSACHLQGGIDAWKKASGRLERES
jgi:rhodanese-related sulfurtransferase